MGETRYDKNWDITGHLSDDGKKVYDKDWNLIGHISDDGKTLFDKDWTPTGHVSDDGKIIYDKDWNVTGHVSDDGKTIYSKHWDVVERSHEPSRAWYSRPHTRSYSSGSSDSGWAGWLIGAIIVLAILYFIFAFLVPIAILNLAAISLIAAFARKEESRFYLLMSLTGLVYLVLDTQFGWLSNHLVENFGVSKQTIDYIFYGNVVTGLSSTFFMIKRWLEASHPISDTKLPDYTWKKLLYAPKRGWYVALLLIVPAAALYLLHNGLPSIVIGRAHSTLAKVSTNLMKNLDNQVTVRTFFTEDLPAPYSNNRRALLDRLNTYKACAGANLQFEVIDPTGPKGEKEAQQNGIMPVQVQVEKNGKVELKRAYMGMVISYEGKNEVFPVIQNPSSLEYDITKAIRRLTSRIREKIGFLSGHGEPALSELSRVQQLLSKQYQLTTIDISRGKPVPADISALIVMAPTQRFPETDKYQIDQYIMRGGKVAFLLNKVDANLQQRFGHVTELNLEDLVENYGLRINPDLVRDSRCASISIAQKQSGFDIQSQVPFPYLPLVSEFSKENVFVKNLQGVVLFFASSVDTANLAAKNLQGEIILRSSAQSGRQTGFFMFDPLQKYKSEDFANKEIPLAAIVYGQFRSCFAGKEIPRDTSAVATPPNGHTIPMSPASRIVLVGDGDFARDQNLSNKDNLSFFANVIDYLVDDSDLTAIWKK